MQKEKIALIALVIIVVAALSVFLIAVNTDIFETLFEGQKTIESGDYADVHYIGKYASNDSIFDSSYAFPENKTGGTPTKIFATLNITAVPGENYTAYSNMIDDQFIEGFIENLIGMKQGQTKTTASIPAEKAYGVSPKVGDLADLTEYIENVYGIDLEGKNYSYTVFSIKNNSTMPPVYASYFGNITTTIFTVRDNSHYIGEFIDLYSSWENSSIATKINETKIWTYTTPPENLTNNFTWAELDSTSEIQVYTEYPTNSTSITNITNATIVLTHTPPVNSTITVSTQVGGSIEYLVEAVTNETINTSYSPNSDGNKTYVEFDRHKIIQRNESQNITIDVPGEIFEIQLLQPLRGFDGDFNLSYNALTDKIVYYEISVVKVYKAS
jgi:hypothetical protein